MPVNPNLERLKNINIEGSARLVKKKIAAFQALYKTLTTTDFDSRSSISTTLETHKNIFGVSNTEPDYFQEFTKDDFTDLQTDVAQKYATILLNQAELQPDPDLSKLGRSHSERNKDIKNKEVTNAKENKSDLTKKLDALTSKIDKKSKEVEEKLGLKKNVEDKYHWLKKYSEDYGKAVTMLSAYDDLINSSTLEETLSTDIEESKKNLIAFYREKLKTHNIDNVLNSKDTLKHEITIFKKIIAEWPKKEIEHQNKINNASLSLKNCQTELEELISERKTLLSVIDNLNSSEQNQKRSTETETETFDNVILLQNQLKEAKNNLTQEAQKAPSDQAQLIDAIEQYETLHHTFYNLIDEYNKTKDDASKIPIPARKKDKATRKLSTGVKIEANIKGLIGPCPREWTGELLTDIARIDELKALAVDHAGVSISSDGAPPPKGMSVENDERYVMKRTFRTNPTNPTLSVIGMLVQEPNGTVTNHSQNLHLTEPYNQQLVAIQMAQMFVRNYLPPKAIVIRGRPEDQQMAKMLHATIKKILPNANIINHVPGGEPSFFEHPLSETKKELHEVIEEIKPEIMEAQNKYDESAQAQKNLNNAIEGRFWGLIGKKTGEALNPYRELANNAREKYESTGIEEGEEDKSIKPSNPG